MREMMSGKEPATNGFGPRAPRPRHVPGAEMVSGDLPPGAAPGGGVSLAQDGDENLSKAALKNKKKREAKKAKEAEAKSSGLQAPGQNGEGPHDRNQRSRSRSNTQRGNQQHGSRPHSRRRDAPPPVNTQQPHAGAPAATKGRANGASIAPAVAAVEAPELSVTSPGAGTPEEKKIRSLLKKLRAIDDLKMRQAGGEKLEGTQVLKIGTEEQVRKELTAAGYTGD